MCGQAVEERDDKEELEDGKVYHLECAETQKRYVSPLQRPESQPVPPLSTEPGPAYWLSWAESKEGAVGFSKVLKANGLEAYVDVPGQPEEAWIVEFGAANQSPAAVYALYLKLRDEYNDADHKDDWDRVNHGDEGPYDFAYHASSVRQCEHCTEPTWSEVKATFDKLEDYLLEEDGPPIFKRWMNLCFRCMAMLYEEEEGVAGYRDEFHLEIRPVQATEEEQAASKAAYEKGHAEFLAQQAGKMEAPEGTV
jgi:hypothetical protein